MSLPEAQNPAFCTTSELFMRGKTLAIARSGSKSLTFLQLKVPQKASARICKHLVDLQHFETCRLRVALWQQRSMAGLLDNAAQRKPTAACANKVVQGGLFVRMHGSIRRFSPRNLSVYNRTSTRFLDWHPALHAEPCNKQVAPSLPQESK